MGGFLRPSLRFTRTRVSINVCRGAMRIHHVWQGSSKCAQQVAQRVAQQRRDAESPALKTASAASQPRDGPAYADASGKRAYGPAKGQVEARKSPNGILGAVCGKRRFGAGDKKTPEPLQVSLAWASARRGSVRIAWAMWAPLWRVLFRRAQRRFWHHNVAL